MTFAEAIELLLQGKRIRLTNWPKGNYLDIWHGYIAINNNDTSWHWYPTVSAIRGTWEAME